MATDGAANGRGNGHFQSHYIPNTPDEQAGMLASLGISSIDELSPTSLRNTAIRRSTFPNPCRSWRYSGSWGRWPGATGLSQAGRRS